MLARHDAVLLEVVARELEDLASQSAQYRGGPLGMAAQLLRTFERAQVDVTPALDRGIDAEKLKTYLVTRGLAGSDAGLTPQRSALGFSKDTYLVAVEEPGRPAETLAIRRDLPAGPTRTTVTDEFPVLRMAHEEGLAVAEPLAVESDPAILGRPFMLTRGAAGRPDYLTWAGDQVEREAVLGQLADFLARLHRLPAEDVPVRRAAPAASPRGELAAYVRQWQALWEECGRPELPQVADAYRIIESQIPELERLALVHADVGFHNILVHDSRITAVLDWEFAHFGEPEEDLAYARKSIEALMPWERFLEAYAAAGGPSVSAARVRAYEIWRGVRNATCCAVGRKAFEAGLNSDLRLAYAGRVLLKGFADEVALQLDRTD